MLRACRFLVAAATAWLVAAPAAAAAAGPESHTPAPLTLGLAVERFTLANGLRVVLHADHTVPTVAISLFYDVGSRNEREGRTGFAHMFEDMMFQGSANLPKGELAKIIVGRGGTLGGGTGPDLTHYYFQLPANELALGLWAEADRMRALDVTADNFTSQREVVKEEVLSGLSGPAGGSGRRLSELVFQGYWPYAHSTGGLIEDLDRAEFTWIKEFHDRYYGPDNAVLAVAGDLDPANARALIEKYFGRIPKSSPPPYVDPPLPPEPSGPRDEAMRREGLHAPMLLYGWMIPFTRHADHYPLELAAKLLGDGC